MARLVSLYSKRLKSRAGCSVNHDWVGELLIGAAPAEASFCHSSAIADAEQPAAIRTFINPEDQTTSIVTGNFCRTDSPLDGGVETIYAMWANRASHLVSW
jgi:hypothetical protein